MYEMYVLYKCAEMEDKLAFLLCIVYFTMYVVRSTIV